MFRRPLGFNGRIGLAEFWLSNIVMVLSGLALAASMITSNADDTFQSDSGALLIYLVILGWFGLAQIVKRSNDLGKTFASRSSLAFRAGDSSDNESGPSPYHYKKVNWLVLSPAFIGMFIGVMKGIELDFPIMLGIMGFSVGILAGSVLDIISALFESNRDYKPWQIESKPIRDEYFKNLEARLNEKITSGLYNKELTSHIQDVLHRTKSNLEKGTITLRQYYEIVTHLERSLQRKR
jgi:uncharacterized membrane protein YhaH (DUF805 family)